MPVQPATIQDNNPVATQAANAAYVQQNPAIFGNPPPKAPAIPPSTAPTTPNSALEEKPPAPTQTYPVVTSKAAQDDVNNMKSTADSLSSQVQSQTQSNSGQTGMTTGDNSQGGTPGGTPPANQSSNGQQPTQTTDNSDLTKAITDATSAITPPDQQTHTDQETGFNQQQTDINTKLAQVQTDMTAANNTYQTSLQQMMNGTFPLSPQQTALVQQMQSANQSLILATQTANQNYLNGVRSFGITQGLDMYSPVLALQAMNQATQNANAAVAKVEQDGVKSLADLQNAFQTQDFDLMKASYDSLNDSLKEKETILNNLSDKVLKMAQDATTDYNDQVKEYQTSVQNAITNAFKGQTLTDTEKKNLFDEGMAKVNFTEKQKVDAADIYYKGVTAAHEAAQVQIAQENADTNRLKLTQATDDASKAALNATVTTPSGNKYVDGSNLDTAGTTAALNAGQVVLKGDQAKSMSYVTDTETQLSDVFSSLVKAGLIDQKGTPLITHGPSPIQIFDNGSAKNSIKQFNDGLSNTITELKKIPGTGDLVSSLNTIHLDWNSSPTDFMNNFETVSTDLQSQENSLLKNSSLPQEGATGTIDGKPATFTNGNWVTQ